MSAMPFCCPLRRKSKGPDPGFAHLLPFFEREKAKPSEIIAFSRAVPGMEKVPDRAHEGHFAKQN